MTSTPNRSQASSIALLIGWCALRNALNPAALSSSTRRSSARSSVVEPMTPLSWCRHAPRSFTVSPLMRRPLATSICGVRIPNHSSVRSILGRPEQERLGSGGGSAIRDPRPRVRHQHTLTHRLALPGWHGERRLVPGDDHAAVLDQFGHDDTRRGKCGVVLHGRLDHHQCGNFVDVGGTDPYAVKGDMDRMAHDEASMLR